jgi:uncharacterized protein YecE (DUF72 family)
MSRKATPPPGRIRVGIGGWTYPPWRGLFYPAELPQKDELAHASRAVTVIEINATFYRTQSPASFARWRDATTADFSFAVKAPRYATHRASLADAAPQAERFLESGVLELREKLGPLLWQLPPTKRFDRGEVEAFLQALPLEHRGVRLRHAVEARHASFACPAFVDLARRRGVAIVYADSTEHPSFSDVTADFVYARLMRAEASRKTGYPPAELKRWAARARTWAEGGVPDDLPRIVPVPPQHACKRDVFVLMINGAKARAPAAACALLAALGER